MSPVHWCTDCHTRHDPALTACPLTPTRLNTSPALRIGKTERARFDAWINTLEDPHRIGFSDRDRSIAWLAWQAGQR